MGRIAPTQARACFVSVKSGWIAAMASPVHASSLGWRLAPAVEVRRGVTRSGVRGRGLPAIEAKRSAKKRQERKLDKRDDVRDLHRLVEERKDALEAAATFRAEPPAPPENPKEASERIERRLVTFRAALEKVGETKRNAQESDAWDPTRGYKPFEDVQDAVFDLDRRKTEVYEAYLEKAIALLCLAKNEPPVSLDTFDWIYEKNGARDGNNARTLSFMLAALCKHNVASGMVLVLKVAVECGVVGGIDKNIGKKAIAALSDLNEMGLLDEGEPEVLQAVKEAIEASA